MSTGKVAGLLGAVLAIALLAFAAGYLLGFSTAAGLETRAGDGALAAGAPADDGARAGTGRQDAVTAGGEAGADGAGSADSAPDAPSSGQAADPGDAPSDGAGGSPDGAENGGAENGGAENGNSGGAAAGDQEAASGYQVFVGEHAVAARATAAAERLTEAGFPATVVALEGADGPWFRVVVGGFAGLARAREAALQIRTELGVDTLLGPPPAQAANAEVDG